SLRGSHSRRIAQRRAGTLGISLSPDGLAPLPDVPNRTIAARRFISAPHWTPEHESISVNPTARYLCGFFHVRTALEQYGSKWLKMEDFAEGVRCDSSRVRGRVSPRNIEKRELGSAGLAVRP